MFWNFTLSATASGTIDGGAPFRDALLRVEMTVCRLASGDEKAHNVAIFNGNGVLWCGVERFAFDPNRYGLLVERDELAYGDWLTVSFGTVDSPLLLAGFPVPRNTTLQHGQTLRAEPDTGLICRTRLEALAGDTLRMASIQLDRGNTTPQLTMQRAAGHDPRPV